ncbi:TetR/AcrR family transcriptional regulator [Consotaella salsifontis]|uniref:Transcriptional regulator, TetR family n=1 Tax=Consotaella salsifontis TaxID=1365950 RepID=A0A1T4QY06_9HYPH|nr:TetR/AcrR family transcriptional regulator [Consotaella salsifontis]SKA08228.1 transcriptional regulator, TetR family [Consotaella salsifontis]
MTKRERRRGSALEDAILDAAWAELIETGYGRLTMESVAQRAATSRTVLYRRWPSLADLAVAAVRHNVRKTPVEIPDTGGLRGDLIDILLQFAKRGAGTGLVLIAQMRDYFAETGTTPADLRSRLAVGEQKWMDIILERGIARGEIDAARVTPRITALPADLLRNELLMTLRPVPRDVVIEIVDQIFLPLVSKEVATALSGRE